MRARTRTQSGSEHVNSTQQPLMHRNSSNSFQECSASNNISDEAASNSCRAVALYTPFLQNGSSSNHGNVAGNNVTSENDCSPLPRQNATQPSSSTIPNQVEPLAQEEPLPAGWEMRYDVYGRR